jgi:RNA polymerase sigma-70 factor (ECF subfamily)
VDARESTDPGTQIVQALRRGERKALAQLFELYGRHLQTVLQSIMGPSVDVSDLLHDVFVTAIEDIHRLEKAASLKSWLTSIAIFRARAFLRRRRLALLVSTQPDVRITRPPTPATPDVTAALRCAYEVLDQMASDERVAFVLRAVYGMKHEEIAEACGVSLSTAKRRVARAVLQFQQRSLDKPLLKDWLREC